MRKTLLSLHALKRWGEQDQLLHCNIDKIDDLYTGRGGISHSSALPADFFEVLVCRRFHFLPDPVEVDHFAELAVREGVLLSSTQRAARINFFYVGFKRCELSCFQTRYSSWARMFLVVV